LANIIATSESEDQLPWRLIEDVGPSRRESLAGIRSDRQETKVKVEDIPCHDLASLQILAKYVAKPVASFLLLGTIVC
jgi:hypothetical protein